MTCVGLYGIVARILRQQVLRWDGNIKFLFLVSTVFYDYMAASRRARRIGMWLARLQLSLQQDSFALEDAVDVFSQLFSFFRVGEPATARIIFTCTCVGTLRRHRLVALSTSVRRLPISVLVAILAEAAINLCVQLVVARLWQSFLSLYRARPLRRLNRRWTRLNDIVILERLYGIGRIKLSNQLPATGILRGHQYGLRCITHLTVL